MNKITITTPAVTMTSREIAELVEARHDSVKRSMDRLREQGVVSFTPSMETSHEGSGSRPVEVYLVGKRDSYVIVAQLSPEFTARLVDRWQELEADAADPVKALNDPSKLRQVLLGYTEKVLALEHQVEELAPKAEALDRLEHSEGSFCLTDAAKTLKIPPGKFIAMLQQLGWIYRRSERGDWLAHERRIVAGDMKHNIANGNRRDGTTWTATQARVTAKGLARLAKDLSSPEAVRATA